MSSVAEQEGNPGGYTKSAQSVPPCPVVSSSVQVTVTSVMQGGSKDVGGLVGGPVGESVVGVSVGGPVGGSVVGGSVGKLVGESVVGGSVGGSVGLSISRKDTLCGLGYM